MGQALRQLGLEPGQCLGQFLAPQAGFGQALRHARLQRFAELAHDILAALVQLAQLQSQVLRQVAERPFAACQRLHRLLLVPGLALLLLQPDLTQTGLGPAQQQDQQIGQHRQQHQGQQHQAEQRPIQIQIHKRSPCLRRLQK